MTWRTDKPTEKIIVAKLIEEFCHIKDNYSLLYLTDKPYQHYCEYGEEIPYSAIEKWASLEEENLPEGLEEAAERYGTEKHPMTTIGANESAYDFKAGAEWQRKQGVTVKGYVLGATQDFFLGIENSKKLKVFDDGSGQVPVIVQIWKK